jgi:hypothetical protein
MKWIQNGHRVLLTVLGIDGRSSRLYHIEWLASTRIPDGKGGSFTEKIDMSVTE